jgi:PAS domain S-box-containing protein
MMEIPGLDDTLRLYAFAPVSRARQDWYTAIGIPTRAAFAQIDRQLRGSLAWLGLVAMLTLAAAWFFANRFVLRPVEKLLDAAGRMAGGDLTACAGLPYGAGELGELARGFDDMAASLEQRQTELRRANRALRMLSDCNQVLIRAKEETNLLNHVCRVIVDVGGYRLAWVGMAGQDETRSVKPVAQIGFEEGYLTTLQLTWADEARGRGPTGTAIRLGQPVAARDIQNDPNFAPWRVEATRRGYASSIALPLKDNDRSFGALNIYAAQPDAFDEAEVALLTELADDLAFGVITLRARAARRRAEEQVAYQAHLLQDISDAVIATDLDFKIISWNKAAEALYGWPAQEVIGRMVGDVVSTEYIDTQSEAVIARFQAQEVWRGEVIQQRRDGTSVNILATVSMVKDCAGQPTGTVAVNRDITEYRRLEERVRQAQKMESIGHLAGGIAHDFNNLLMPMIGYADLSMAELSPDSKIFANLVQIRRAAERAADLTRQILAFSRKQILELKTGNLNDIIIPFEGMLRRLIGEDIELQVNLNPVLASVRADTSQIEQVILNLAVNARDAMPTGGKLTIETDNIYLDEAYVARYVQVQAGPYVLMTVSDTGHGMDQATLNHIFEPFFTTKEVGKGTGLGLATVFGIVKQHNGNIWAYSEPGHGTTFKVYLPAVQDTVIAEIPPPVSLAGSETVLLAEDDPLVREMVADCLEAGGYRVLAAENAEEALQLAAQHGQTVHLLITDVILPGTNGANLHQALLPHCPDIKVLFISGYTDNVIVHRGILKPGVSFLQKPFSMRKLLKKVRQVLDRPAAD